MIAILMATYNGEKYIAEQLESLLAQTVQDFMVYIHDDCSTDETYKILKDYAMRYPNKFIVFRNERNSGGTKYNFIEMMIKYKSEYVMLCDQDDVWKPNKIAVSLNKMNEMEQKYGINMPLLVHTDLEVVDETLKTISPSFRKAMNANYSRTELRQIVIQNTLTGCTAIYNKALSDLIFLEPQYMVMHDWWLILVASAFGKVGHINDCTIYYRQHEENIIGAKKMCTLSYKLSMLSKIEYMKVAISQTYEQADSFLDVYRYSLTETQTKFLKAYCAIPSCSKPRRIAIFFKLISFKNGISRIIAQILFC